jgi:hypothetical protein
VVFLAATIGLKKQSVSTIFTANGPQKLAASGVSIGQFGTQWPSSYSQCAASEMLANFSPLSCMICEPERFENQYGITRLCQLGSDFAAHVGGDTVPAAGGGEWAAQFNALPYRLIW